MDEFGKGTCPSDGIGIFAAVIHELCAKNAKIMIATHFFELFTLDLISSLNNLALYTMQIHTEGRDTEFLYQLVPGRSLASLGVLCAKKAGCSEKVIDRASLISDAIGKGDPIPFLVSKKDQQQTASRLITLFMSLNLVNCDLDQELGRVVRSIGDHLD